MPREQDLEEEIQSAYDEKGTDAFFERSTDGGAFQTAWKDKDELFTKTEYEEFMIQAAEEGLLDRPLGEVDATRIPGYSLDAAFVEEGEFAQAVGSVRYFVYDDQFVKVNTAATLSGSGYKKDSEEYKRAEQALLRESSMENVDNFMLFTEWGSEYEMKGGEKGLCMISGSNYAFALPNPVRLEELANERRERAAEFGEDDYTQQIQDGYESAAQLDTDYDSSDDLDEE